MSVIHQDSCEILYLSAKPVLGLIVLSSIPQRLVAAEHMWLKQG